MDDFKKTQFNLKVSLDLDDQLTWDELFKFVDLARASGYIGDQQVGIDYVDDDPRVPGAFVIYLHPEQVAPVADDADDDEPQRDEYNPVN